jgi:hypothetical protein
MKKILTAAIVLFGIVAFSMPANAEFVKDEDPGGLPLFLVNSSSFKGDVGSQTSGVIVNITTDVNVDTGNGEATIKPSELTLKKLTFTPANGTLFGDFSFGGALVNGGTITVKVWDNQGSPDSPFEFTFSTDASGNFGIFGIVAEQGSGETIQKVEISSSGFKQVKQIDFSYALVPEPVTMLLLGLGLLGLGIAVRKRS